MHRFHINALSKNIAYFVLALVTQQETAHIYEVEDIYSQKWAHYQQRLLWIIPGIQIFFSLDSSPPEMGPWVK